MTPMLISMRVQTKIQVRLVKNTIQKRKKIIEIKELEVETIVVMNITVETKLRDKHMLDKVLTHSITKLQRKRKHS
jgi:hypothetical protein